MHQGIRDRRLSRDEGLGQHSFEAISCSSGDKVFESSSSGFCQQGGERSTTDSRVEGAVARLLATSGPPNGASGGIRRLSEDLYGGLAGHCLGSDRWLSDIHISCRLDELRRFCGNRVHNLSCRGGFEAVIFHREQEEEGHAHFVHSCKFSGSYCRCAWLRGFKFKHRAGRRPLFVSDISAEYLYNWLQYYCQEGRQFLHLEVGKISYLEKVHRFQGLQRYEESQEGIIQGLMETCRLLGQGSGGQSTSSGPLEEDQGSDQGNGRNHAGKRKGDASTNYKPSRKLKVKLVDHFELVKVIQDILCTPFYSTCETKVWLSDPNLCFFDKTDVDYKRAVSHAQRCTQHLTIFEIIDMIARASRQPVWYARHDSHYMNILASYEALHDLLLYQYVSEKNIKAFLTRLYNVCEKVLPKKNSMFVHGGSNCGKTFFFDAVMALYLNVGHVANMVRGDSFPLNDCLNRRILLWNEPSICPSAYDSVKMIAGGDPCPANIKYQGHSVITRTPLIFTSNNECFNASESVWSSRIYFEEWKPLKNIVNFPGSPIPTSILLLWRNYDIIPLSPSLEKISTYFVE